MDKKTHNEDFKFAAEIIKMASAEGVSPKVLIQRYRADWFAYGEKRWEEQKQRK